MIVRELIEMLKAADPDTIVGFQEIYGDDPQGPWEITGMIYGGEENSRTILTNEENGV